MTSRDYVAVATKYASDVVLGHIPAAKLTALSCQRFLDDLKRADHEDWFVLEPHFANRICRFVEMFPLVKGSRKRIVLLPWQVFVLVNIYGWVDDEGFRRFKTVYLEMPKKQGKSTFVAPLPLFGLCMDDEEGAECYTAAVNRKQARIVWEITKQMANRTPAFKERFGVECGANAIMHAPSGSTFQALSREGKSLEGVNPSLSIIDEFHRHQTREVWDILDESREARMQPLQIAITNTGSDKSSICYEQRSYLVRVLKGYNDPTFFGIVYTVDPEDIENWDDPEVWAKAQPSLGTSTQVSGLKRLAQKAKLMAGAKSSFMRYQLGVWTAGEHAWLPSDKWEKCEDKNLSLEQLRGQRCYIGIDLASKVDLAAMVAVFLIKGVYTVFGKFYVPKKRIKSNDSYLQYAEDGHLIPTPGTTIDFSLIEEDLLEWNELFVIEGVPYDPHQATQFATRMTAKGLPMVEFNQVATKYSEPMKEIERAVVMEDDEGNHTPEIAFATNDALTWMVENVVVEPDRKENIFPRKEKPENKIDGAVGMIMGCAMWIEEKEEESASPYDKRGLREL